MKLGILTAPFADTPLPNLHLTLLDWLGADSSTPRGVMALWPLATTYYVSGLDVFDNISRRYWLPGFWRHNTVAVVRELLLLGPVAALGGWFSRRVPPSPPSPAGS